jgi:hypothetical protein
MLVDGIWGVTVVGIAVVFFVVFGEVAVGAGFPQDTRMSAPRKRANIRHKRLRGCSLINMVFSLS